MDLLSGLRAGGEVEADGLRVDFGVGAGCGVEVEEDRRGLEHHLFDISIYAISNQAGQSIPTGKCSFHL